MLENQQGKIDPELLLRRAGWLRSLAVGLAGDRDDADDMVQEAFLAAIEKPPRAANALGSWLRQVVKNFARLRRRESVNRRRREEAAARPERQGPSPAEIVERAETQERLFRMVLALDEPYRATVLQRFFEDLTPAQIARREGIPATTVRSRLLVALERLRARLDATHGGGREAWRPALLALVDPKIFLTRGGAGAALSAKSAAAVKVGSGVLSWPFNCGITALGGVLLTQKIVVLTGLAAAALLAAGIGIGRRTPDGEDERARLAAVLADYQRAVVRIHSLEEEKVAGDARWRSLLAAARAKPSPAGRAPAAPPAPAAVSAEPAGEATGGDALLRKLLEGGMEAMAAGELSAGEIERTLEKHGREPQLLIAAAQLSTDPETARRYLEEALEKDPASSPALLALLDLQVKAGDAPEALSATIERLRACDPESALPSCYAARTKFQAGDARGALEDMLAALSRPKVNDYNQRNYEAFQQFYRDAGRGDVAAKVISAMGLRMGYLPELRDLSKAASAEANRLLEAGDGAAAEAYAQAAAQIASKLSSSGYSLLHHAVGTLMEKEALEAERKILDARGAAAKVEEIDRRIEESRLRLEKYRKIAGSYLPALAEASEAEISRFFDRVVREGEVSAALDLPAVREAIREEGR